jgi:hypothetical protein
MPDPAEQLQQLYLAGFELQTFERFPRAVGISRQDYIALVEASPEGLKVLGTPGWKMGDAIGVLVEKKGRQVFQSKDQIVEATPERLEKLRRFREELDRIIAPVR